MGNAPLPDTTPPPRKGSVVGGSASSVDPVWETIYGEQRMLNRYPFDQVVSFVYTNCSRTKPRSETAILEIGCGAGNNLWFAAREGFTVAGIDGSASAVEFARERFAREGLQGDFRVGDIAALPFDDDSYDLVIDREAVTHNPPAVAEKVVDEVRRVLRVGGAFFFNPYSDRHSGFASGRPGPDGMTVDIPSGTLEGIGTFFYAKRDVVALLSEGWKIVSLRHLELREEHALLCDCHAEWIVIVEKI
jgi:SAM-dependent methyltransferase